MGKIRCPSCNKKILESDTVCPKCYLPVRIKTKSQQKQTFKFLNKIEIEKIQEKLRGSLTKASFLGGPPVTVEVPKYPATIFTEKDADNDHKRAQDLAFQNKFNEAIIETEKVLRRKPKPPIEMYSYFTLGFSYLELGQYEDAIHNFDVALKIMYDNHPYYQNGEPHDFKHINKMNVFTKVLFSRALAFKKKLDFNNAITNLSILLVDEPLYVDAWILKGNSHKELKEYNDALKCYNRALELDPDNILAQGNKELLP